MKPQEMLEQFKQQGYAVAKRNTSSLKSFMRWCKQDQQPLIYVEQRGGNLADVEMDLIFVLEEYRLNARSQEKVHAVYDVVSGLRSGATVGPVYTRMTQIDMERAVVLAQALVAIYQQNQGREVPLPAFGPPPAGNLYHARMEEAKRQGYIATYRVTDPLGIRWQTHCEAYDQPFIQVHESRKGYAEVVVRLPPEKPLTPAMQQEIQQRGISAGMKSDHTVLKAGEKWYMLNERGLKTMRTIPTDRALTFAQEMVQILQAAGYYQDENALE